MYEDELTEYEMDAEDRYDDYEEDYEDGYYEDDFDPGFEGNEDTYDDEDFEEEIEYLPAMGAYDEDSYYDSYTSSSIGRIDPNDRTLTVTVVSAAVGVEEAIVFGGNENAAQAAGVTVSVAESSHAEVREESKSNPFKIVGMKMRVSDSAQFDNVLRLTKRTATGQSNSSVYQPRNATSPQNFDPQLIDDHSFEMDVTGQDSLRFNIAAGATVVFTFTIKARANMGNLLKGNNVAELARAPRTTGLPQIDLLTTKQPTAFGLKTKPAPKRKVKKIVRRKPVKSRGKRRRPRRGFLRRRRR